MNNLERSRGGARPPRGAFVLVTALGRVKTSVENPVPDTVRFWNGITDGDDAPSSVQLLPSSQIRCYLGRVRLAQWPPAVSALKTAAHTMFSASLTSFATNVSRPFRPEGRVYRTRPTFFSSAWKRGSLRRGSKVRSTLIAEEISCTS